MKQRIFISESERREILNKHSKLGYKTINENATNYTILDIQNKLNQPPYNAGLVADNRFGPKTSAAIMNALERIKTSGVETTTVTTSDNKPSETNNTTPTVVTTTENPPKEVKTTVDNKSTETNNVTPNVSTNVENPPKEDGSGPDDSRIEE